jgi:hypothetical protein
MKINFINIGYIIVCIERELQSKETRIRKLEPGCPQPIPNFKGGTILQPN